MRRRYKEESFFNLNTLITGGILVSFLIVGLIIFLINAKPKQQTNLEQEQISARQQINDEDDEYEVVSIDIGKKVDEAEKELMEKQEENNIVDKEANATATTTATAQNITNEVNNTQNETEQTNANTNTSKDTTTKESDEIKFVVPVKGKVIREFAPDSLVYSETLEEWVTHNGVDIAADKTSVVVSAAKGTVESINNDPRYGLTVIVSHSNGYKTLYANLLTAEFVVEGEEIEEGQTIGTIGNSATFEIADEYHLHFEVTKDGDYVDPCQLVNF